MEKMDEDGEKKEEEHHDVKVENDDAAKETVETETTATPSRRVAIDAPTTLVMAPPPPIVQDIQRDFETTVSLSPSLPREMSRGGGTSKLVLLFFAILLLTAIGMLGYVINYLRDENHNKGSRGEFNPFDGTSTDPGIDPIDGTPTGAPAAQTPTDPGIDPIDGTPTGPPAAQLIPSLAEWQPLGPQIQPLLEGQVGTDIAMSADGSFLAVGVPIYSGYVAVYRLISNQEWELVGREIIDDYNGGVSFGTTVDLSADGRTVAAGSGYSPGRDRTQVLAGRARVFTLESDRWVPKGNALFGTLCRSLGWSVALSGDGNRWVVSTPDVSGSGQYVCDDESFGEKRGQVQIFDYDADIRTWVQVGQDLTGPLPESFFGLSVAIARDGKRVAASFIGPDRFDFRASVRVFEQNGSTSGRWQQVGSDILVEISEFYTRNVALSADGMRVAVASKRFVDGAAFVRVLEWMGGSWVQLGEDIVDEDLCCFFYTFENSVDLSDDGSRVVFGNSGHEPPGTPNPGIFRGIVRVYDWDGSKSVWVRVGSSIPGQIVPHELWFGYSTTISSDGNRIAGGAPVGDSNYVQAYELNNLE
jgi:hypothetical protein